MKRLHFSVLIAIVVGVIILYATFFPTAGFADIQGRMVDWAVTLAGISMLIGIFNLLRSHWDRMGLNMPEPEEEEEEEEFQPHEPQQAAPEVEINADGEVEDVKPERRRRRRRERKEREKMMEHPESALVLIGFGITFLVGMVATPADAQFLSVVSSIQVSIESSLLAMVSVVLLMIAFNFFQRRHDLMGFVFIGSVLVFLILGSGLLHTLPGGDGMRSLIALLNSIPLGGTRGILIGIALGSLITALRQLLGIDQAYRE